MLPLRLFRKAWSFLRDMLLVNVECELSGGPVVEDDPSIVV
jgi:hypothetical protein